MGDDPKRSIKAIRSMIKNNEKKIEQLKKEVDKFEERKKKKAVEQQNAKREITKKLVKQVYKFLEKDSDSIIIRLMEAFVAMLRNRPTASREDVELYLRKHDGLMTAMNKVDPRKISGGNAKNYTDTVQAIRNEFSGESPYVKYIPFLVFLNQTCAMVNLTVEEKGIEQQIVELEDENKNKHKEIDEIETFEEHVDMIIDYDIQVDQEKKQLALFKNHKDLLDLRINKLSKYSRMFERYYYAELKDTSLLRSTKRDKLDRMDDLDQLESINEKVANLNLAKTVTRVKRDERGHNPVGSNKKVKNMEAQARKFKDDKSEEESDEDSEGESYEESKEQASVESGEDETPDQSFEPSHTIEGSSEAFTPYASRDDQVYSDEEEDE